MNIKTSHLEENYFPFSYEQGAKVDGIHTHLMRQMAKANPVKKGELKAILSQHHLFLTTGGIGGKWQAALVNGIVAGIYTIEEEAKEGMQASFERRDISGLSFLEMEMPFSNYCGAIALKTSFDGGNFAHSLMTDADFCSSSFEEANLSGCDFSRSELRQVNFRNANLQGADFENCDLTGANFEGAKISGARFPGACLDQVIY